jgi:hypothetical protein
MYIYKKAFCCYIWLMTEGLSEVELAARARERKSLAAERARQQTTVAEQRAREQRMLQSHFWAGAKMVANMFAKDHTPYDRDYNEVIKRGYKKSTGIFRSAWVPEVIRTTGLWTVAEHEKYIAGGDSKHAGDVGYSVTVGIYVDGRGDLYSGRGLLGQEDGLKYLVQEVLTGLGSYIDRHKNLVEQVDDMYAEALIRHHVV